MSKRLVTSEANSDWKGSEGLCHSSWRNRFSLLLRSFHFKKRFWWCSWIQMQNLKADL